MVNIASRRRLAWAEILQVNLRPGDPWVFLDLSDGTSLPALGIQPGIAKQRAIADARALRALAEARLPSETPDAPGARSGLTRGPSTLPSDGPVLINLVAEALPLRLRPCRRRSAGLTGAPATRGVTPSSDGRIVL